MASNYSSFVLFMNLYSEHNNSGIKNSAVKNDQLLHILEWIKTLYLNEQTSGYIIPCTSTANVF